MFRKKLTVIFLLLIILTVPSFAGLSLADDIIYVKSPHEVLKISMSKNTDFVKGTIKDEKGEEAGSVILLEEENQVAVVPVKPLEEGINYNIKITFRNSERDHFFEQVLVYDEDSDTESNYLINITEDGVVTLRKYSEMDKLEKVAHDLLFGFTNLKETIDWNVRLTDKEVNYIFDNYLANQKNQIRLNNLDNADYLYELSEDHTEWLFYGIKGIEYYVEQQDMDELNARYEEIRGSLDLENKTNREKSEIIAIKLVELFDYNSEGVSDSTLQNQSYFSVLHDKTVCAGYTTAYSHLLNLEGIRSDYVTGDYINNSDESTPHTWNKVYLSEDEIVYTDVTHMDRSTEENLSNYEPNFLNSTSRVFDQEAKRVKLENVILFSTEITH